MTTLKYFVELLSGHKTYFVAIAMLIVAYHNKDMKMGIEELVMITGRAANAKVQKAIKNN